MYGCTVSAMSLTPFSSLISVRPPLAALPERLGVHPGRLGLQDPDRTRLDKLLALDLRRLSQHRLARVLEDRSPQGHRHVEAPGPGRARAERDVVAVGAGLPGLDLQELAPEALL